MRSAFLPAFSTGAPLRVTRPVIWIDAALKPGAEACAEMVTCDAVARGVHVPEYTPALPPTPGSTSGGSPFENVVTTCPVVTGFPQSSVTVISSGVGQDVGSEKLFTRPVCVGMICVGVHPGDVALPETPEIAGPAAGAATISVMFTVRTWPAIE